MSSHFTVVYDACVLYPAPLRDLLMRLDTAGQLVGVEVKAAATVKENDLRRLKSLESLASSQFKMGVLLYDGTATMPFGDGIWAAPLSTSWGT
jgi:hypothetical protein